MYLFRWNILRTDENWTGLSIEISCALVNSRPKRDLRCYKIIVEDSIFYLIVLNIDHKGIIWRCSQQIQFLYLIKFVLSITRNASNQCKQHGGFGSHILMRNSYSCPICGRSTSLCTGVGISVATRSQRILKVGGYGIRCSFFLVAYTSEGVWPGVIHVIG